MPVNVLSPPNYGNPDAGLVSLYKEGLKQQKDAEQEAFTRVKGTVASLIDSYQKADSLALQETIRTTMKRYESSLPTVLRAEIEPYIAHGPTSKMAEKKRHFLQQFKPPTRPTLNEAQGETAEIQNRQAMIQYSFDAADYDRRLAIHMTGVESAPEKLTFLPLPDGTAAVRDKDNRISILSQQDLGLKELEKKTGIPVKDMLLNPGGVPTGNKSFLNLNGRTIVYERTFKPWESSGNQYGQRIAKVESMPASQWKVEHPPALIKLMMDWKTRSPKDKFVEDIRELANGSVKESRQASEELSSLWPEYSFKFIKQSESLWKKALNLTPFWSSDESIAIIPIPGVPRAFKDASGADHIFYYNSSKDLVFNTLGQPLGSYADVDAETKSRAITRSK